MVHQGLKRLAIPFGRILNSKEFTHQTRIVTQAHRLRLRLPALAR